MQNIYPCLWFDGKAEEAMNFYLSVFRNGKIISVTRHGDAGPGPKGTLLAAGFEADGQRFMVLNGGPMFTFTPAISFVVDCATQDEVDSYWDKLSAGGQPQQCGWLSDRFGVSWQIVPTILPSLLQDKDPAKANRVMQAMMKMVKLDIAGLKQAAEAA